MSIRVAIIGVSVALFWANVAIIWSRASLFFRTQALLSFVYALLCHSLTEGEVLMPSESSSRYYLVASVAIIWGPGAAIVCPSVAIGRLVAWRIIATPNQRMGASKQKIEARH